MNDYKVEKLEATGERVIKVYRAFEGDVRIITEDKNGNQYRYTVKPDGRLERI